MTETSEIIEALIAKEKELTAKVSDLKNAEAELSKVQAALKALAVDTTKDIKHNGQIPTSIVYRSTWTWKEKIKYAVTLKGEVGLKDISEFIQKTEPSLNYQTIYNSVAVNIGEMVKKKALGSKEGDGRKVYFIID